MDLCGSLGQKQLSGAKTTSPRDFHLDHFIGLALRQDVGSLYGGFRLFHHSPDFGRVQQVEGTIERVPVFGEDELFDRDPDRLAVADDLAERHDRSRRRDEMLLVVIRIKT